MYIRPVHAELDLPTLNEFIQTNPLGLFTTAIPHPTHATIQTSHVPFVLDPPAPGSEGKGILRGHMARANPQVKAMIHSLTANDTSTVTREPEERKSYAQAIPSGTIDPKPSASTSKSADLAEARNETPTDPSYLSDEVLILFQSPINAYVTPKFYTTTKPLNGKVVPTWDYAAVQVYGKLRLYHLPDDSTSSFLTQQINDITIQQERLAGHNDKILGNKDKSPGDKDTDKMWEVKDAPESYVDLLKKGIVGMEIEIERCEGRFKLSQEIAEGDWAGVVSGFEGLGTEVGRGMAGMVRRAGEKVGKGGSDEKGVEERGKEKERRSEEETEGASWAGRLLGLVGMGKAG